jgi:hypothetical protein
MPCWTPWVDPNPTQAIAAAASLISTTVRDRCELARCLQICDLVQAEQAQAVYRHRTPGAGDEAPPLPSYSPTATHCHVLDRRISVARMSLSQPQQGEKSFDLVLSQSTGYGVVGEPKTLEKTVCQADSPSQLAWGESQRQSAESAACANHCPYRSAAFAVLMRESAEWAVCVWIAGAHHPSGIHLAPAPVHPVQHLQRSRVCDGQQVHQARPYLCRHSEWAHTNSRLST